VDGGGEQQPAGQGEEPGYGPRYQGFRDGAARGGNGVRARGHDQDGFGSASPSCDPPARRGAGPGTVRGRGWDGFYTTEEIPRRSARLGTACLAAPVDRLEAGHSDRAGCLVPAVPFRIDQCLVQALPGGRDPARGVVIIGDDDVV